MELTVQKREKLGKTSQRLKAQGLIPAEAYGHGFKNEHLAVKTLDFLKVFREAGENTIVSLVFGQEKWPVLIYDVRNNPLNQEVTHIDFYRVTMTEKIKGHIPLEFLGESPVVKEKLGILNKAMLEVEVEALPADLPHRISIDLSLLDTINKSIYAKDLKLPSGVKILIEPETVIVTVIPPKKEEAPEVTVDVSAVRVETDEKKAEREAESDKEIK